MARPRTGEQLAARRERRAEITDPAQVMEAAAMFLAVRPRSVAETRRRLRHLGYPHPLVDQVLDRLIEMEYLDDEAFARVWVESRDRARPRGETALRRELALKGVAGQVANAILAERSQNGDESADADGARRLLERRRAALEREEDPARRRQKAYRLLAANGFDPGLCSEASAEFVRENAAE